MGPSNNVDYGMPVTWESPQSERKMKGAMMSKIARNIRKQARQRTRSSTSRVSSSILEQASKVDLLKSMEEIVHKNEIHSRIPNILHSLDGKRLKKLLTKKLKTSDVGFVGRIVLPKKEAEKNLPALSNKEGIEVLLKDEQAPEVSDYKQLLSNKEEEKHDNSNNNNYIEMPYQQKKDDDEEETCLGELIDELFNQKDEESSNKLSTMYNVEGSSSNTEEVLYNGNASQEVSPNGTVAPTLSSSFQDDLDDFFEGLDMSQFGCNDFVLDEQQFVDA
ncbi:B3 domain-containing transcription factor LEC2-like [Neltuma alba]|uniref:B3 domain-containing transcription factor LEC2-like n=1 Tax=Neltuma alba TaxID=207710 RepID=UPI0010A30EE9|nr:B3 domain-containing transcription factor LEC2-like [Prosopis alba]